MTEVDRQLSEQILDDYSRLEPGQTDAWNPVGSKYELGYRLNLFYAMARALQKVTVPLSTLRVLDLGCGNGRSARTYLGMGLRPDQITGIDFRPGAIAMAKGLNPAIQWQVYGGEALPDGFNWISTTTVFSSIHPAQMRARVAQRIHDALPAGGYAFYYDYRRAQQHAGRDPIEPRRMFRGFDVVWHRQLGRFAGLPLVDQLAGLGPTRLRGDALTVSLREMVGNLVAPAQEALLLRRRG